MRLKRHEFYFASAIALALLCADGALAAPLSHQLPSDSAINQAKQYLQQHKPSLATLFRARSLSIGLSGWTPKPPHIEISDAELESMPLGTTQQLESAQKLALNLEEGHQFTAANKLYLRILKRRQDPLEVDTKVAQALEAVARTDILSKAAVDASDAEAQHDWNLTPIYYGIGYGPAFHLMERLVVYNAIQHCSEDLSPAEELYSRALAIHRQLGDHGYNMVSDLIFFAALKDRQDKTAEAKACYLEAIKHDHSASEYIVSFCLKHKDLDFAKQNEGDMLSAAKRTSNSAPIARLLTMYVEQGRPQDALRLFREAMYSSLVLPTDVLISMFDLINHDDLEQLNRYLTAFNVRISLLHNGFEKVMQAMEKHGWGEQVDSICQYVVSNGMSGTLPHRLFVVAEFYRHSGKYERAFQDYKKLVAAVGNEQLPDELSIKQLSDLTASISSAEMKQRPDCQELLAKASTLIAFHKNQIRRRKYFDMTEDLSHRAYTAERNAQFDMAQKLYEEALELCKVNLEANDPETANRLLDVARTAREQKHYAQAQSFYERALAALQKNANIDPSETIAALENYGQMLNEMKQEAKANTVYDQAKAISRKIYH